MFVLVVEGLKVYIEDLFKKVLNFVDRVCKDLEFIINVCVRVLVRLFMIYY